LDVLAPHPDARARKVHEHDPERARVAIETALHMLRHHGADGPAVLLGGEEEVVGPSLRWLLLIHHQVFHDNSFGIARFCGTSFGYSAGGSRRTRGSSTFGLETLLLFGGGPPPALLVFVGIDLFRPRHDYDQRLQRVQDFDRVALRGEHIGEPTVDLRTLV